MKRLITILLALILILGIAYSESPATPTDLEEVKEYEEFDDDDCGCITAQLDRQVFLQFMHEPAYYYGEEISLVAILINFLPEDICIFRWEYSLDGTNWDILAETDERVYTFILDEETAEYYWRVKVIVTNYEPVNIARLYHINDYQTPLGILPLINQAGDCFD